MYELIKYDSIMTQSREDAGRAIFQSSEVSCMSYTLQTMGITEHNVGIMI
jgi:hypothetical protein